MNNKKRNNKGFSLVELIVVVAIMAVLVGVLAPAYLTYVEKSRIAKDESALEEVRHAVEVAVAEEDVYDDVTFGGTSPTTVTISVADDGVGTIDSSSEELKDVVTGSVGTTINIVSKTYKETDTYTITLNSQTDIAKSW